MNAPRYLTQAAAATYLAVSLTTFKRHVRPHVPCVYVGTCANFDREDLDRWASAENATQNTRRRAVPWLAQYEVDHIDPAPTHGGIYFLQSRGPTDRAIKIGWARNIRSRLADQRTEHPWPLFLLAVIPDATRAQELSLHKRFRESRIKGAPGREWFVPSEEVVAEIVRCQG